MQSLQLSARTNRQLSRTEQLLPDETVVVNSEEKAVNANEKIDGVKTVDVDKTVLGVKEMAVDVDKTVCDDETVDDKNETIVDVGKATVEASEVMEIAVVVIVEARVTMIAKGSEVVVGAHI